MREHNISVMVGTLIVATLVAVAYWWLVPPQGKENRTAVSVRLAWIPGVTFIGDYVAKEKGFWREEGLEVALNPGGFEFDAVKLVASGADTFGIASGPQILQARASGVPVVSIGAVIPRSPIGWVAKRESGIRTPYNFVDKKVGAQFGTHTEITFEALLAKLNIPLTSVERIPVKFDPRPFVAGAVDVLPVYIIDQPVDLRAQGLDLVIIDPHDYGVSLAYGNLYFSTEKTVEENPDVVRKFLEGSRKGWLWAYNNRQEALDILAANMANPDTNVLRQKLDTTFSFIEKDNSPYMGIYSMTPDAWASTADIMQKYGRLSDRVDVNDAFTNVFLPD